MSREPPVEDPAEGDTLDTPEGVGGGRAPCIRNYGDSDGHYGDEMDDGGSCGIDGENTMVGVGKGGRALYFKNYVDDDDYSCGRIDDIGHVSR